MRLRCGIQVDPHLHAELSQYTWTIRPDGRAENHRLGLLHRYVMRMRRGDRRYVRFRGDKSDCRKRNLFVCSHSKLMASKGPQSNNRLALKGVSRFSNNRFRAVAYIGGQQVRLGLFSSATEAAIAYNDFARRVWPGCYLNPV